MLKKSASTCLAIQSAATEEQVVSAVREYLDTLSAEQVALMPAGLTVLARSHAEDVVHTALQLVHHEILSAFDAPEAELIREAVSVFSTAATRLATLAALRAMGPLDSEKDSISGTVQAS
jgi:glucokinase